MDQPKQPPTRLERQIVKLRQQLNARDQLVDQLSAELFRLIQAHPPLLTPAAGPASSTPLSETERLRQELQALESQIEFYQQQIDDRDAEINQLQHSCQSLSDRNQMLERLIQDLPEVYKKQFSGRLDQVKTKMKSLQTENQRLYSQLQETETDEPQETSRRLLPSFRNPRSSS